MVKQELNIKPTLSRFEQVLNNGVSVLEVVNAFEQVNRVKINYEFAPRRDGDIATCFADNTKAVTELGWQPKFGLSDMLRDSWNWQKNNPNGYREPS